MGMGLNCARFSHAGAPLIRSSKYSDGIKSAYQFLILIHCRVKYATLRALWPIFARCWGKAFSLSVRVRIMNNEWREIHDYNFVSSSAPLTDKMERQSFKKYIVIPLRRNDTFKQRNFASRTFFFVVAVLVRVARIRTDKTRFWILFKYFQVKVWSKKLPLLIGNYVTVNISLKFYFCFSKFLKE